MADRRTVVIVGAGIGGLTAAIALARAGYAPLVVERSPEPSEAGAGIQIAPNAGRGLALIGLDAAIAAKAIEPTAIEVYNGPTGQRLTSIGAEAFRHRYGAPYRVLHRSDLQSVLLAAARNEPSIRIENGATVSRHMPQGDGLLVRVAKGGGSEVAAATALIGADGVWSDTRDAVPGAAAPAPTGRTAWRTVVAADAARDIVPLDKVGLWLGPDAHLVHYPVSKGSALNIVATVPERWEKPGWSAAGEPAEIAGRFAGWAPRARALIAAPLAWQKYALVTVDPAGPWANGRVALLGDAAHAMLPFLAQGAAMAIEDAVVLADCLYGADAIEPALDRYAALRRERVLRIATASRTAGRVYHLAGMPARARDISLRAAGHALIMARNDWIYRWRAPAR